MSLEAKIEALVAAVQNLSAVLAAIPDLQTARQAVAAPVTVPTPAPAPTVTAMPTAASLPISQPLPAQAAAPAPAPMPPPPSFLPPPPAVAPQQPQGAPFSDLKGLIGYTMEAYKSMGPTKGAQIQKVLQDLGTQNINDLAAAKFGQFYTAVEALKVAA